jgi:hypothetical protein
VTLWARIRARLAALWSPRFRQVPPVSPGDHTPDRLPEVAARLRKLWREGTGREGPTDRELAHVLAIAWLETGAGGWWASDARGDMRESRNLGAIQCTRHDLAAAPPPHYRCVTHADHHADGTEYVTGFRYYLDTAEHTAAEWAAVDFLRFLSAPSHPLTGAALARGAGALELADAMHREKYFEGDATHGKDPVRGYALKIAERAAQAGRVLGLTFSPESIS